MSKSIAELNQRIADLESATTVLLRDLEWACDRGADGYTWEDQDVQAVKETLDEVRAKTAEVKS